MIAKNCCTGCGACAAVCAVNAISMEYDEEGFIYPSIDADICTRCQACDNVCPVLSGPRHKIGKGDMTFNLAASYPEQENSASGGVFWILAKQYLEQNQYVAGAVWTDNWEVEHIVTNRIEDAEKMRSSKYIQSNLKATYCKIKDLLNKNKKVLFCGTPCQVAGLKKYLGADYENLFTIDLICHGVASHKLFARHLKEINKTGQLVQEISFRNKEFIESHFGLYIKYATGDVYLASDAYQDIFWYEYANDLNYRLSCYDCHFRDNFYGDMIIGDAGHININTCVDKKLSISVVIPSSKKGMEMILKLITARKFEWAGQSHMDAVIHRNQVLVANVHRDNVGIRNKIYQSIQQPLSKRYDIMLVVCWAINYGTILTNYALSHLLEKMGYSVVVLNHTGKGVPEYAGVFLPIPFMRFIDEHFHNSITHVHQIENTNELADMFVVGSDMIWDYGLFLNFRDTMGAYMLDWVHDDKRKISYATSFGNRESLPPDELREKTSRLLGRMDAVSVRESWGVDICNQYGVFAEHVLDPVWMLDKQDYIDIMDKSVATEDRIMFVYLLYPDQKRVDFIHKCEQVFKVKAIIALSAERLYKNTYNDRLWQETDFLTGVLDIPEWLGYMYHADYVLTDSYHGTCFSIIFEKQFLAFPTNWTDRYETLLEIEALREYITDIDTEDEHLINILKEPINYAAVNRSLDQKKKFSYDWLCKALGKES